MKKIASLFWIIVLAHGIFHAFPAQAAGDTLLVSAEGLVDPNADVYKRDKGAMIDDLREDAKRQLIEKAVGVLVESSSLVENYELIHDRVLTKSKGLIKRVVKESSPWQGKDGFMHLLMQAEVYITQLHEALESMSAQERIHLIKERGDPKISVAVNIRDVQRGSHIAPERSPVAENILKEHIKSFGYRVWSEETTQKLKTEWQERTFLEGQTDATLSVIHMKAADFTILGEAKFESRSYTLERSGIKLTKYVLTSWSVKCVDNNTGEEIYFNTKIPKKRSWNSEDEAMEDIGRMIGAEFSKDFFEQHLNKSTSTFQLQVMGLPNYDTGLLLRTEFIGLRPIIKIEFREFDESGLSLYEVEFAGSRSNFNSVINNSIIKPLNEKMGETCFNLVSAHGNVVRISFQTDNNIQQVLTRLESKPPASLAEASPERLRDLIKSDEAKERVEEINPLAKDALNAVKGF